MLTEKGVINMNVKQMQADELIPYENNPRFNENAVDKVAASIKEFGFKVPIIVDSKNVIVAGHTRLLAAKELGMEQVPVIVADDLTDNQIKAFRLADNKVSEFSEWDFEMLEAELSEIESDMDEFGFGNITSIDWEGVPDLGEDTYDEPKKTQLKCPSCGAQHFKNEYEEVEET